MLFIIAFISVSEILGTMTVIARRTLPVDRERQRICDKAYLNRVTLIVGGTGCGKSSQVPQMLLEELGGPVLCTQPRRLAVVAVAKRVAEERGVVLGQEVRQKATLTACRDQTLAVVRQTSC